MAQHIALGQLLSLGLTFTGSASAELAHKGVSVPFFQSGLTYALVGAACWWGVRKTGWKLPQWKYMLLGGCDVCATWCIVRAFKYTSITSVSLLDAWSVPCVMLLTAALLRTRYTFRQVLACAIAISGLVVLLVLDSNDTNKRAGSRPALGDFLVLLGASGYAVTNVYTEHLLHHVSMTELLAGLGRYGALFALVSCVAAERAALRAVEWSGGVLALLTTYSGVQCGIYVGIPLLIKLRGSAFLNLSMLTSDLYSAAARVVFFASFTRHAALAFATSCTLVVAGLITYFTAPEAEPPGELAPASREVAQAARGPADTERQQLLPGRSGEHSGAAHMLRRPSASGMPIPSGAQPRGDAGDGLATSAGTVLSVEMEPVRRPSG